MKKKISAAEHGLTWSRSSHPCGFFGGIPPCVSSPCVSSPFLSPRGFRVAICGVFWFFYIGKGRVDVSCNGFLLGGTSGGRVGLWGGNAEECMYACAGRRFCLLGGCSPGERDGGGGVGLHHHINIGGAPGRAAFAKYRLYGILYGRVGLQVRGTTRYLLCTLGRVGRMAGSHPFGLCGRSYRLASHPQGLQWGCVRVSDNL